MKNYLIILLALFSASAYAQKTYTIPADSTKLTSVNGTGNELIIENDTKDTTGVLYNGGAGRTTFKSLRLQQLTDSTFRLLAGTTVQGQVITIRGTGGGGGATYTLTKNATRDSIILTGSNGSRLAVKDSSGVPYTGAVTDVDLGANNLNAEGLNVTGVNGNGYIHLRHQASDATAGGQTTSLFANSSGDLKYKNDNLYYTTFQTSGNSANRVYRFPDSTGTVALLSNIVNLYNSNGAISANTTRKATINDTGATVMFTSALGDKGIAVGDSLRFWYGQGETLTAIDGATMYKTYIDTNNNEGYTAFHNVYNLNGSSLVSYSGMRDLSEGSESLFGTFHINGQTGANAFYSNWGYTNPVTEEAIGITLDHFGDNGGFRLMPYSEGSGYTFKSDSVFRVYDTLRNTILATDVDGNVKIEATGDLSFVGLPDGGAADTFVTVTNTAGVVSKLGKSDIDTQSLHVNYYPGQIDFILTRGNTTQLKYAIDSSYIQNDSIAFRISNRTIILPLGSFSFSLNAGRDSFIIVHNGIRYAVRDSIGGGGSGWALTGNAVASDSSNFIGTTNSQPLNFYTNNSLGMKLDQNKYLSVNKTNAIASIDVRNSNTGNIYLPIANFESVRTNVKSSLFNYPSDSSVFIGLNTYPSGNSWLASNPVGSYIESNRTGLYIGSANGHSVGGTYTRDYAKSAYLSASDGSWNFGTNTNYGYRVTAFKSANNGDVLGVVNTNGGTAAKAQAIFYANAFGYAYVASSGFATTTFRNAMVIESAESNGVIIHNSTGSGLIRLMQNTTERFRVDANGSIGINTVATNNTSAILQIDSNAKGFLPPRMTATQAEAISSPAEGLLIYSTDGTGVTITSKGWWGYEGSTWVKLN